MDGFLDFRVGLAAHAHPADVHGVHHQRFCVRQGIKNNGLSIGGRGELQNPLAVFLQFIIAVPHPLGAGLFKVAFHWRFSKKLLTLPSCFYPAYLYKLESIGVTL